MNQEREEIRLEINPTIPPTAEEVLSVIRKVDDEYALLILGVLLRDRKRLEWLMSQNEADCMWNSRDEIDDASAPDQPE